MEQVSAICQAILRQLRVTNSPACRYRKLTLFFYAVASNVLCVQIVPGHDNDVAINLIATHIRRQLKERATRFRPQMAAASRTSSPIVPAPIFWQNLSVAPQTAQMQVRPYTKDSVRVVLTARREFSPNCGTGRLPELILSSSWIVLPHF